MQSAKLKKLKNFLEILSLLTGLLGTLLITFATRLSPFVKHGLESGDMAHSVVILHPTWINCGVFFIMLAFVSGITKFIVTKIGEKR